jgi:hypothetical protein
LCQGRVNPTTSRTKQINESVLEIPSGG